jgi:HK97 family phage prohead protease
MLAPLNNPTTASVFGVRTTIDADGTVVGYASLFGEIDQSRDMVMRGAFATTLAQRGIHHIPMLFQHDPSEPVGIWQELREDHRGLFARGRLIPEVARARELFSLIREGAIDGLSIGFRTVKGQIEPRSRIRKLVAVDLWEISIVTFPLLAGARVHAVKHSPSRSQNGFALAERGASSRLKVSRARTCAEQDWAKVAGGPCMRKAKTPRVLRRSLPVGVKRHAGRIVAWRRT